MLILEGTDIVGKTVLAQALVKRLCEVEARPTIYSHFTRLPDAWDYFWHYLPYITRETVQDRFHMSEVAYGTVARQRTFITPERYRMLDAHLRLVGSYTVVITAEREVLRQRWDKYSKRGEMYTVGQALAVNEAYVELARNGTGRDQPHVGDPCSYSRSDAWFSGYRPDVDLWVHVRSVDDWPSADAELVERIADQWLGRLLVLTTEEERRGTCRDMRRS